MKIISTIFVVVFLAAIAAGIAVGYSLVGKTFRVEGDTYLYVYPGDDAEAVSHRIDSLAAPSAPLSFSTLSQLLRRQDRIRTGRYLVTPSSNMLSLLRAISNHNQQPLNLVVPSVRTVHDLAGRISSRLLVDSVTIDGMLCDSLYCASLGYTPQTIPSLFIPNTYEVYWDTPADQLLQRLQREHAAFWNSERTAKAEAMGLTPIEVSTLASIIDSETSYNPEKPRVAGLYLNRLSRGMLLQSDPTVIFALGDFTIRRVMHTHLLIDSPYNTYRYAGLPPGPIRIPSIAAIDAVLNYEPHDYIYMCAKEDFSGSHNFAATYAEHSRNARRYAQALNQRGIK